MLNTLPVKVSGCYPTLSPIILHSLVMENTVENGPAQKQDRSKPMQKLFLISTIDILQITNTH